MEYKTRKGGTPLGMVCSNMVISSQEGSHAGIALQKGCGRSEKGAARS
jgi:hypothetical protein